MWQAPVLPRLAPASPSRLAIELERVIAIQSDAVASSPHPPVARLRPNHSDPVEQLYRELDAQDSRIPAEGRPPRPREGLPLRRQSATRARRAIPASLTWCIPLMVGHILADMRMDMVAIADRPAARRRRGHQRHRRAGPQGVRRGSRALRRRRHQAQQARFLLRRGPAGRELPQDAAGHGRRHPRHHGQAGRPHAQHAHARLPEPGAARAHRARDHRDLRAHRAPPRAWARSAASWKISRSSTWSPTPTQEILRRDRIQAPFATKSS